MSLVFVGVAAVPACGDDGGGSSSTTTGSGGSASTSCGPGTTECGGGCVDTDVDPSNCGACGTTCLPGEVCSGGTCDLSCQVGLEECGGLCVDPKTSNAYCGASGDCQGANAGTTCAAGEVCSGGTCDLSCQAGLVECGGLCVDPQTSNAYCGASGDCLGANAGTTCLPGEVCSAGTCDLSCQAGLVECGGTCVDPQTSNAYCGASGDCQGANAGTACAADEYCDAGACTSVVNGCVDPTVLFSESFASNAQGWSLGATWAIGAAMPSACGSVVTGNDPAADHSPTLDNGIAGVAIGGCYGFSPIPKQCLTSPSIDVTSAANLRLSFWRHLHTDYPPYVSSTVEVWNGSTWTEVFSNPNGNFVNDLSWTYQLFDVTEHRNASFRVRFCYQNLSSSAIDGGGWNLDDVSLVSCD
jgi:hypothetical protein